ncbi:MAG: InlB B-repeat-containing protein [Roseburia sp.]|nr:InlB B-repeat-containing protein [Roseburia sp.]
MRKHLRYFVLTAAATVSALMLFACSEKVSVTVELNGGEASYGTITVDSGDIVDVPQAPTKDGCIFDGWWTAPTGGELFDFFKPVTKDTVIYAHWSEDGVAAVSFDLNLPADGVYPSEAPSGLTVRVGEKFTPPTDPVCGGYIFKGWFERDGADAATAETVIDGDITYFAHWAKLYTVSFVSNMGTAPEPIEVEENAVAVLPNILTDGYTLGEWCTDSALSEFYDETQPIVADVTLYAKFYRHTSSDAFYYGSKEGDYERITGIKPEAISSIGDTLVIPDIRADGGKIGRFFISELNTSGANAVDLSGIKKVVLSNTLNKPVSDALDLMENLECVVGGRGGRDYTTYAGCVYSNEDDAYYRLNYVPKKIDGAIVPIRNDGTKIFVECDSSDSRLRFDGLGIAAVTAFEIDGAPKNRLDISILQTINVRFIVPDEYIDEYAALYAKEFYYNENGNNGGTGVLVFIEKSKCGDAAYIAERTSAAEKARDDEIKRQMAEWAGRL